MMQRPTALVISAASLLWATGCSTLPAGDVNLVIDGKKQNIRGSVSLSSHAGGDVINVGDPPLGIYVHLPPGGSGVEELDLGNSTGKSFIACGAKVSEHNGRYQISGEAVPADTTDPSASKPFELQVKCP